MAKLYFRYGAMGSSKTANALMVEYNYYEQGKKALLLKPRLDTRDGEQVIKSRMGLWKECSFVEDFVKFPREKILEYDCIIVDEAQFCKKTCNVRFTEEGNVIREGEQVCLGGNDKYTALCRKHYREGNLGPEWSSRCIQPS